MHLAISWFWERVTNCNNQHSIFVLKNHFETLISWNKLHQHGPRCRHGVPTGRNGYSVVWKMWVVSVSRRKRSVCSPLKYLGNQFVLADAEGIVTSSHQPWWTFCGLNFRNLLKDLQKFACMPCAYVNLCTCMCSVSTWCLGDRGTQIQQMCCHLFWDCT